MDLARSNARTKQGEGSAVAAVVDHDDAAPSIRHVVIGDTPLFSKFLLEPLASIDVPAGSPWLVKNVLPTRGMMVIYGAPGTGKSFVSLDLALHIAAGRRWADRRVRQAGVVYVAAEGGFGLRKRIVAALAHHRIDRNVPFALITAAPNLGTASGDADALVTAIRRQTACFSVNVGLIVLDTLARSMTGSDESNAASMGQFIATIEEMGRKLDAVIVPVHHAGKDPTAGMRGSSALNGAANGVWRVERDGSNRTITVEKSKDDQDGAVLPFRLVRTQLDVDDEGDPITTCVVEFENAEVSPSVGAPAPAPAAVSGQREAVLNALAQAISEKGTSVQSEVVPLGMKVVTRSKLWPFLRPIAGRRQTPRVWMPRSTATCEILRRTG